MQRVRRTRRRPKRHLLKTRKKSTGTRARTVPLMKTQKRAMNNASLQLLRWAWCELKSGLPTINATHRSGGRCTCVCS